MNLRVKCKKTQSHKSKTQFNRVELWNLMVKAQKLICNHQWLVVKLVSWVELLKITLTKQTFLNLMWSFQNKMNFLLNKLNPKRTSLNFYLSLHKFTLKRRTLFWTQPLQTSSIVFHIKDLPREISIKCKKWKKR